MQNRFNYCQRQVLAALIVCLIPSSASAHDGDMSILLYGPLSFLGSLFVLGFFRAGKAAKVFLLLVLWPLLFGLVFATIQPHLLRNAAIAGENSDDVWLTLAIFYQIGIPLTMLTAMFLFRRYQRRNGSRE